jgi:hypothetical protein
MNIDGRTTVTSGKGPIVLRIQNGYTFYEHGTIPDAKAEAARLAERIGGEFVVLVPVAIVRPAPKTVTTDLVTPDLLDELRRAEGLDADDSYPF